MLDFSDAPYQFFPAKPNRFLMALGKFVNRRFILKGKNHRITQFDLCGEIEKVKALNKSGAQFVIVANHPTHSDPQIMTEVHRRLGIKSCFMAAYDVFLRGKFAGWLMQNIGCFSIDREGSDRKAMAEAARILKDSEFALTIFPEGNVYLTNDKVTPFLDGASFLALKAQKDLGDAKPIYVVPMAFKYSHITDVRSKIGAQLDDVAIGLGTNFDHEADPVSELKRIGREVLIKNLKQRGCIDPEDIAAEKPMSELLVSGAEKILSGLETKIDLPDGTGNDPTARIRKIRSAIHNVLTDDNLENDHRVATSWADEAILAFRILQYATPYALEKPTVDRIAETVERVREDLTSKWQAPTGPRHVEVQVREPILLADILNAHPKLRTAVTELTGRMESEIQAGLNEANAGLETPGSELF